MNDKEMQTEGLQDSISWLNETANQGREFVIEQAPLYAQEYLSYKGFSYGIGIVISLLLAVACSVVILLLAKKHKSQGEFLLWDFSDRNDRECPLFFFVLIIFIGTFVISFGVSLENVVELAKVILAPRVVLLDHVSSLIN